MSDILTLEQVSEPFYMRQWKYLLVIMISATAALLLMIIGTYLIIKIFKIVKFKGDPTLLLSISSITLSLGFLISFLVIDGLRIFTIGIDAPLDLTISVKMNQQQDRAKVMLIFVSLVFDLYKWCIFIAFTSPSIGDYERKEKIL
jgi:hypothetical protein